MRLLLDTHVVLWQLSGERELSADAKAAIENAVDLLVSVVSYAEIGIKAAVGKLEVPSTVRDEIADMGVRPLALTAEHGLAVRNLPVHHRDPFDRLLVAQAYAEQLTVVSADPRFSSYPIQLIKA